MAKTIYQHATLMDHKKHICQKITRVQGKTKSMMLISVKVNTAFEYCFHLFLFFI